MEALYAKGIMRGISSHYIANAMPDDIEHRLTLARALRGAGVGYDLIAEVLRANARTQANAEERSNSRVTEARKLMAATLRQRDVSDSAEG